MRVILILLAACMLLSCKKNNDVEYGIPLNMAVARKEAIRNLSYDLFFDIPEKRGDSIPARAVIKFEWKAETQDIALDFLPDAGFIRQVAVNGEPIRIRYNNEHILVGKNHLETRTNTIAIDFLAGEAALNRNDDYLYTLFVPSRASTCFPLFDQPDLKAVFNLELRIPSGWKALSNGKVIAEEVKDGKKNVRFALTRPTSFYQFAFTAL